MKKSKTARVPVLENALEINLLKLMRMATATGESRVILDNEIVRTLAMLTKTRLAIFLGDRPLVVEIVPVQCLQGRVRPLLKCPRARGEFSGPVLPDRRVGMPTLPCAAIPYECCRLSN